MLEYITYQAMTWKKNKKQRHTSLFWWFCLHLCYRGYCSKIPANTNVLSRLGRPIRMNCLVCVPPAVIVTQNLPDIHTHEWTCCTVTHNAMQLARLHAKLSSNMQSHDWGWHFDHAAYLIMFKAMISKINKYIFLSLSLTHIRTHTHALTHILFSIAVVVVYILPKQLPALPDRLTTHQVTLLQGYSQSGRGLLPFLVSFSKADLQ